MRSRIYNANANSVFGEPLGAARIANIKFNGKCLSALNCVIGLFNRYVVGETRATP